MKDKNKNNKKIQLVDITTEKLIKLVSKGDQESIEHYLDSHSNKVINNVLDHAGNRLLHIAVQYKQNNLVKMLLERGANPNLTKIQYHVNGNLMFTPLHIAVKENNTGAVPLLIKYGADTTIADGYCYTHGRTPLRTAIKQGKLEMVKAFLQSNAPINTTTSTRYACYHIPLLQYAVQLADGKPNNVHTKILVMLVGQSSTKLTDAIKYANDWRKARLVTYLSQLHIVEPAITTTLNTDEAKQQVASPSATTSTATTSATTSTAITSTATTVDDNVPIPRVELPSQSSVSNDEPVSRAELPVSTPLYPILSSAELPIPNAVEINSDELSPSMPGTVDDEVLFNPAMLMPFTLENNPASVTPSAPPKPSKKDKKNISITTFTTFSNPSPRTSINNSPIVSNVDAADEDMVTIPKSELRKLLQKVSNLTTNVSMLQSEAQELKQTLKTLIQSSVKQEAEDLLLFESSDDDSSQKTFGM